MDQFPVSRPTQKEKEVIRMSKILMLVVSLAWFGQGVVWELMPDWAWPVWGRAGLENIFSRVKIFGQDIG
jgi:hypothetical protein